MIDYKHLKKVVDNFDANNPERGRLANITLTINANSYNEQTTTMGKVDIILVLDGSNSMKYDAEGNKNNIALANQRLTALKSSAKSFIEGILDNEGNVTSVIKDTDNYENIIYDMMDEGKIKVRYISKTCPCEGAVRVEANLEDAYLCLLKNL